ncbi:Hsp70 family protein [Pseudodesulfovibrio portus]|uniref:Molecular chaperone DnaK n=1 Tax=Pseudodesulfovibrio portus TaxID=231439 RepID=A0ABN6RUL5_9BACT|nr:Hsp70 family protein [Pseudodesulfovibrio portus]BDQ33403.1 molecular chaperone DnaK [Pseudodesulfovibrio portus]
MGNIVGIDLGTTYSAIGVLDETGRPSIMSIESENSNIMPSIVLFEGQDKVVTGVEAQSMFGFGNTNVFGRFKREMGNDVSYQVNGQTITPTSLSSFILKRLKDEAEAKIGPIDEAVVTIPANFSNEAREATLEAARLAGLNVKNIINEPTAAAMYYAFHQGEELAGTYAVYDLGGGTFDVSIIRVKGQDTEVLASEGVNRLGGDDFDKKLMELVRSKVLETTGESPDEENFTSIVAEEMKKSLSRKEQTRRRVWNSVGKAVNIEISRDEFQKSISSLVAQTEMLCESVLEQAGLSSTDLAGVFLVGGSTRVPIIKESAKRVFGMDPTSIVNPDEAVALGAALYAGYRADIANLNPVQKQSVDQIKLQEISNHYFGCISIAYDPERDQERLNNTIILEKGQKLPCSQTHPFYTIGDGQTSVHCQVTQSATPETDPRFVKIIWEGNLDLPEGRPAGQEVQVTFSYDLNQVMKCSFKDAATGHQQNVELSTAKNSTSGVDINAFLVE